MVWWTGSHIRGRGSIARKRRPEFIRVRLAGSALRRSRWAAAIRAWIAALFGGQGDIPGQGSASLILLVAGLLLGYAAAPGWIELVLMSPNRVGGIAASCTSGFRHYSLILSARTGVCYWWEWVPTCGLTALFSATAIIYGRCLALPSR